MQPKPLFLALLIMAGCLLISCQLIVAPARATGPEAAIAPVRDPQAHLDTLIVEMIRVMDANDLVGVFKITTRPEMLPAGVTPEKRARVMAETMSRDSDNLVKLRAAFKETVELLRSIQGQNPTMSADGTLATYKRPQLGPDGQTTVVFQRVNGRWYPTDQ